MTTNQWQIHRTGSHGRRAARAVLREVRRITAHRATRQPGTQPAAPIVVLIDETAFLHGWGPFARAARRDLAYVVAHGRAQGVLVRAAS